MKIVVVGGMKKADFLIESLLAKNHKVLAIHDDLDFCKKLSRTYGVTAVYGDGSNPKILEESHIEGFDLLIALTPSDTIPVYEDKKTFEEAQTVADELNAMAYGGYTDWRLPTIKELQGIVDYRNAPEFNGKPAINTDYFQVTSFINEQGEEDYPYFWSSTTHASYRNSTMSNVGNAVAYQTYGRALGYFVNRWIDVHGAGAQRSDPKSTDMSNYKLITINGIEGYSFGPQGDAVRGMNYVRLVRDL